MKLLMLIIPKSNNNNGASMLLFCMPNMRTVCRLQTAQTDDRTQFCIYFSIFKLPRDYMYRGLKNNNNT